MLKAKAETILLILNFKKMPTKKMSLANMQGKLSRAEMKKIMAGSGVISCGEGCSSGTDCHLNSSCPKCISHNGGSYQCAA